MASDDSKLTMEECAPFLRAMGDPTRLRIVSALREGPMSVTQLVEALDIPQYHCSRHLAVLRRLGIVEAERKGRRIFHQLSEERMQMEDGDPTLELGCCRVAVE